MWAFKRQLLYFLIVFAFVGGLAFLIIYPYFNKPNPPSSEEAIILSFELSLSFLLKNPSKPN
jgi:uncharacterized membrane-anchored protein